MVHADTILRSAGGQEFRVHKSMLSITSPIFQDMFTFLQPHSPEPSSILVVDVYKSGRIRCALPISLPGVEAGCRGSRVDAFSGKKNCLEDGGRGEYCARGMAGSPKKLTLGKISSAFMELCESFAIA